MKIKYTLIIFALLVVSMTTFAQRNEGGFPASYGYPSMLRSAMRPYTTSQKIDIKRLLYEDSYTEKNGNPLRVAVNIPVNIDIKNAGSWQTLANGQRIWSVTINLPQATGMIIAYDDFYIPSGGKLFLYDTAKTQLLGAFTHNTNPKTENYSTAALMGNSVVLEYDAPLLGNDSTDMPRISISKIGCIYNKDTEIQLRMQSDPCMVDVNCSEGNNWQDQKRGVVKLLLPTASTWYMCSGSLVNNTKQDGTPYVLTASHCFNTDTGPVIVANTQYRFNYENATCGDNTTANTGNTLVGATMKVLGSLKGGSDGVLVRLTDTVPNAWHPYFNGWDHSNTPATSGVVIHHPEGDVKKISTYTTPTISIGSINVGDSITAANAFWQVVYSATTTGFGVTQPGSSGSPLFDQNKHIIGTLTGGNSSCSDQTSPDFYGKFWYHWDQIADTKVQMKPYLDPLGSGVKTLDGYDPNTPSGIENNTVAAKIAIYPSPFTDNLNINAPSIIRSVEIVNLAGRRIYNISNYTSSTLQVDTYNWEKGIYIIDVTADSGMTRTKVIK